MKVRQQKKVKILWKEKINPTTEELRRSELLGKYMGEDIVWMG